MTKSQEYYKKHRKQILEQCKVYYRKNKLKIAAYKRQWAIKNKKELAAYHKKYYKLNHASLYKNRRKWRKNNLSSYKKSYRKYQRTPKMFYGALKIRHFVLQKREKFRSAPMSFISYLKLCAKPCYYCLGPTIDKTGIGLDRVNNRLGYTVKNVVPACKSCNYWRNVFHTVQETRRHFKPMRDAARAK